MTGWTVSDEEILTVEKMLLKDGCHFADDAKGVIRFWNSTDVSACPGSGKTTVLLAKLKIIMDHMPLDNGAGVCVLSHTNVAVDEIKSKLVAYSDRLMSYPNYIGTIQTFIDRYIAFPYLRSLTKESLQVVDDRTYAQHLRNTVQANLQYRKLWNFMIQKYSHGCDKFENIVDYIEGLYLKNGDLYHKGKTTRLAGSTSDSAKQYEAVRRQLLSNDGLITYSDAYKYAFEAINERPDLIDLLSRRFRFVFIDEYQDCSGEQRDILQKAFDKTVSTVINIGDPDQAIYNSDHDKTEDWIPGNNALAIASSNRYSQMIANILTPLRTERIQINSLCNSGGIKPTIIIFEDASRKKVIDAFISILETHQITDPNGVYKVIGWVKSETSKGLKISDYWNGYCADTSGLTDTKYWCMIDAIGNELNSGRIYKVENIFRRILVIVLKYLCCKDDDGSTFTYSSIKKKLYEENFENYRGVILQLAEMRDYTRSSVDHLIRNAINMIVSSFGCADDIFSRLPSHFLEGSVQKSSQSETNNFIIDPKRGRRIQVSTVHKVKGETHDATLYLETENNRKSDLQRVISYYKGTTPGGAQLDRYCRKLVYVGFSRPRKLLCVAMRASTYDTAWRDFPGWDLYDCRR